MNFNSKFSSLHLFCANSKIKFPFFLESLLAIVIAMKMVAHMMRFHIYMIRLIRIKLLFQLSL